MDNDLLHATINAKLAAIVEASPTMPAWYDAWKELGPESTEEERLAVYQAVRDSAFLPAEAGLYLVSWQIDAMTSQDAEVSLYHLDEQMKGIKEAHGLEEGEFWSPGKVPKEYEELRLAYQAAWDGIFTEKLEEFGEREMADLLGLRLHPRTRITAMVAREGPLEANPSIRRHYDGPVDLLHPTFYISAALGGRPARLVRDLIAGDQRFFEPEEESPPEPSAPHGDHNYNTNQALSDAIRAGARGAYWDILRGLRGGDS